MCKYVLLCVGHLHNISIKYLNICSWPLTNYKKVEEYPFTALYIDSSLNPVVRNVPAVCHASEYSASLYVFKALLGKEG